MENELKMILLQISDLKKSLTEIQSCICKVCRKKDLEKEKIVLTINTTISPEDYD